MYTKYFSFLMACFAVVFVFAVYSSLKTSDNTAFASGVMGSGLHNNSVSDLQKIRALRSSISESPENVLDIYGRDVFSLFAEPELVRRDAPTTVWQYRNESCVLDLYFTTQKKEAFAAPVVHYEVRMRDGGAEDVSPQLQKACVRSLARANAGFTAVKLNSIYKAK
jgi:hypothetical protein